MIRHRAALSLSPISRWQPLPGIAAAALSYACGYALRYGLVEPDKLGAACERAKPWWCAPRTAFIVFTEWNGFGWLSVGLAALAVGLLVAAGRGPTAGPGVHGLAMAAMISSGAGLALYNTTFAAAAVIVALLLLCRRGVAAPASEDAA